MDVRCVMKSLPCSEPLLKLVLLAITHECNAGQVMARQRWGAGQEI